MKTSLKRVRWLFRRQRDVVRAFFVFIVLSLYAAWFLASDAQVIHSVSASKPFFNPTLGQTVDFVFTTEGQGLLTVLILDRDGFVVRRLAFSRLSTTGRVVFSWDGRDDHGEIVPDEAYSLKIDLVRDGSTVGTYFPADRPSAELKVEASYYDRATAVFAYRLPTAARVHMQAGVARLDPKSQQKIGPVLKTIVNREPRPAGPVIEVWNGLDETGTYSIADLPDFVMAVAATSLPENTVITNGNHARTFLEGTFSRTGRSLLTPSAESHHHHRGLSALEDVSPDLHVVPTNAVWSPEARLWSTTKPVLRVSVSLAGPSADAFGIEPASLVVFVDHTRVQTRASPAQGMPFEVPLAGLSAGPHVIAFNWASEYGPTAVSSIRVRVERGQRARPDKEAGK